MKYVKTISRIFVLVIMLGLFFIHFYVPRIITEIKNPIFRIKNSTSQHSIPLFDNEISNGKYLRFKSFDNIELSCFITYSGLEHAKGTIILLHGIRSRKEQFIELSKQLSALGYNAVALDSRAHGQSEGTHCTFGAHEKKDISALITVLRKEENISNNIGLWGQSLGGAIALQAMGNDPRIKFGIIESTFSDFRTITNDYFRYALGFNIRPFTNYLVNRAGKIANFPPNDASPEEYCKRITQPILIVHGNNDQRISIEYAKKNFKRIPSNKKEFIEIDKANHSDVWRIGGEKYFNRVLKFISTNTHEEVSL